MRIPLRSRRSLRFLAPGAALFLLLSAGAFAAVETESVHSYWDGLWWSLSLVSTVGFVGAAPATAVGKLVSAALMVLGFVLLATTTAAVASLFVREDELPEDERELGFERDMREALRDLDARLEAIEGELKTSHRRRSDRRRARRERRRADPARLQTSKVGVANSLKARKANSR